MRTHSCLKHLILLTLLIVSRGLAALPVNMEWYPVLPRVKTSFIGISGERFVALSASGEILASHDGESWEVVPALAPVQALHVVEDGVLLLTRETLDESACQLEILFSADLQTFTSRFSTEGSLEARWDPYLVEAAGNRILRIREGDVTTFLTSGDLHEWIISCVYTGDYLEQVYADFTGWLYFTRGGPPIYPWLETGDGIEWNRHYSRGWPYASAGGGHVGLAHANKILYSDDLVNWESQDLDMTGPWTMIQGDERVLILNQHNTIYQSTDCLNWTVVELPGLESFDGPYSCRMAFADGYYWIWLERQKGIGEAPYPSTCHRSPDGLAWEWTEWPEGLEENLNLSFIPSENIPEGLEQLLYHRQSPGSIQVDGLTVEMRSIPEGEGMELVQYVDDGEPVRIYSNWGQYWHWTAKHREPYQLLELNGVFLCRNEDGYLGMLNLTREYFPTVTPYIDPDYEEDRINLQWIPVEGAETYRIYRHCEDEYFLDAIELGETGDSSWTDSSPGLCKSERYYYYVTAHDPSGKYSLPERSSQGQLWRLMEILDPWYRISCPVGVDLERISWKQQEWIEPIYSKNLPWVWTYSHRWWYLVESEFGFWANDAGLGWLWSQKDLYPWIYVRGRGGWMLFLEGTSDPRWFYEYTTGEWISY